MIPKTIVAACPDDPIVPSFHLIGGELHGAIHIFEVILIGRRKAFGVTPHRQRLVFHGAGLG